VPTEISVIIAAYNVEPYIGRAIRSALDQQGVSLEVVLVDDCSTDNTWEVASRIADPRLKRIRLPANGGPGAARNAGIAAAIAPWIAVLDGDDAFLPGRLERLLGRASEAKADIVVDNLLVMHEAGGVSFPMFRPAWLSRLAILDLATFISRSRMFQKGYTFGYFKPVFSAEFLRRHRLAYDPRLRIGEDYLLLAEALARGAICAVESTPGYQYTVRAGSISHRLSPEDIVRMSEGDKKFLSRYPLAPAAAKAQKRRENSLKEAYAYTLLVEAMKQCNIPGIAQALKMCPTAARQLWRPALVRVRRLIGQEI
jgi:succinoglycan biosynthesis protein ExoO